VAADQFLIEWDDRLPWKRTVGAVSAMHVLGGSPETGLAVVVARAASRPTRTDLRALSKARSSGGVTPVLVAVTYETPSGSRVSIFGPDEDAQPVDGLNVALSEVLIMDALTATSPSGLHAELARRLGTLLGGKVSGLRNEGLFASHVLEREPAAGGWTDQCTRSDRLLRLRGAGLLAALGYSIANVPEGTVLRESSSGHRLAAAVLLTDGESFENVLTRLHNANAVTHGLSSARKERLDWLVVLGGSVLRLYPVRPDVGVGRKGQTQTFVELDLALLGPDRSGFLTLLFAPSSLVVQGEVARLLDESTKYAAGLSERLRERVYVDVVPTLAVAVARNREVAFLPEMQRKDALDEAYHQTMIILFRLLFIAYGEDRGLLPYGKNDRYTSSALKTLALGLVANPDRQFNADSTAIWDDLTRLWTTIDSGDMAEWVSPPTTAVCSPGTPPRTARVQRRTRLRYAIPTWGRP